MGPWRRTFELAGRDVLVTGAASGIGRAVALRVAREGARLHLTDLREEPLLAVAAEVRAAGGEVGLVRAADVSDRTAVLALGADLTAVHGPMDVVMNVAGISAWGTVRSLEGHHWRSMVEVNLMGPVHVIEALVPPMVDAGRGGALVNVASAAGIIAMPWHAAYSASKFGLRGVSEVLRFDLAPHRIRVSLVCPGGVATPLTETVQIAGVDTTTPRFRRLLRRFRSHAVTPEQAAEAIVAGVRKGRFWVYTSSDIRLLHLLQRLFPPGYRLAMTVLHRAANAALPEVGRARRQDAA
ncbi:SDR family oxidoreductase [Nocardioides sp. ChNu-153]|uniref:SDR family oxidoreductase n=1 Tax=Nocardioides sp. ChNu-153 TaxID=2779364 RepID=UPI00265699FD|nr:SDR family oxidoreductase [Nocardioides sp. ChNu-153]MDN7121797.1 SDR family oxidoreductase [Nocardioides sp. ChNu-153]